MPVVPQNQGHGVPKQKRFDSPYGTTRKAAETPFEKTARHAEEIPTYGLLPRDDTPYEEMIRERVFRMNAARSRQEGLIDPNRVLRMFRAAGRTRLPDELVAHNLERIEREIAQEDFHAPTFVRNSPLVAQFVAESPFYASMTEDQILNLSNLEKLLKRPRDLWPMPDEYIRRKARAKAERSWREQAGLLASAVGRLPVEEQEVARKFLIDQAFNEEYETLKEEEEFIGRDSPVGFFETFRVAYRENPAFFLPFISAIGDAGKAVDLYNAAKAVQANTATEDQKDMLIRYGRLARAAEHRGTNFGGKVGEILAHLPAFAGEFATTGGVYSAVRGASYQGGRRTATKVINDAVKTVLRAPLASTVQMLVASPPRIVGGIYERMRAGTQIDFKDGTVGIQVIPNTGEPFMAAFWKSTVDSWAEIASERLGGMALFRAMDKRVNRLLFESWLGRHPTATKRIFQRALQGAGVHGVLGEIGEEEAAKLIKAIGGAGPPYALPFTYGGTTAEEFGAQAVAFSVLPFAGSVLGRIGPRVDGPRMTNPMLFEELGAQVRNMLQNQLPLEAIEQVFDKGSRGEYLEFVYIPIEKFQQYFRSKTDQEGAPGNPRKIAREMLGSNEEYDRAVHYGHDLQVPLSRYAVTVGASEHNEYFKNETRLQPDEETIAEVREELEAFESELAAVAQEAEAAKTEGEPVEPAPEVTPEEAPPAEPAPTPVPPAEVVEPGVVAPEAAPEPTEPEQRQEPTEEAPLTRDEQSTQRVADIVREELTRINLQQIPGLRDLSPRQIEDMAQVTALRYARRAELLGVDPFELFRSEGRTFSILGELTPRPPGEFFEQPARSERPQGPRGRTDVLPRGLAIGFFATADPSTFFHETGHVWLLEMREDAEVLGRRDPATLTGQQQQLLADVQTVLDFLGIKSWGELTKDVSEKWARATEEYFATGQAPLQKLFEPFRRFKDWLVQLYRDLVRSGAVLTPGVREVMDRMLASQESVQIAQIQENLDQLFADPPAVFTEKQAEHYRRLIARAKFEAQEMVGRVLMQGLRRRETKEWKAERERVKKEVRDELNEDETYFAFSVLSRGTTPDGGVPDLPSGLSPYKLSREAIRSMPNGQEILANMPTSTVAREGLHPDYAAPDFGFDNGHALLMAMQEVFNVERKASPVFQQEAEIRQRIAALEQEAQALRGSVESVEEVSKEQRRRLRKGKRGLTEQYERELLRLEKQSTEFQKEILDDIRKRGGVRPMVAEDRFAPGTPLGRFKAKKGLGVPSDELAEELSRPPRKVLEDSYSETLYDWMEAAIESVKVSEQRRGQIKKEARETANRITREALEILVGNVRARDELKQKLREVQKEKYVVERSIEVRGSIENTINRLTDERMIERHPEIKTDEELMDEAIRQAHSSHQSELMVAELKFMATEEFRKLMGLNDKLTGDVQTAKAYRDEAQEQIRQMEVRKIVPIAFQRAARRQGRKAKAAVKKGGWPAAFEARKKQLQNIELYRAATLAVREVERIQRFMARFLALDKRKQLAKAGHTYLNKIDEITEAYEFELLSNRRLERRENLREWIEAQREAGFEPQVPEDLLDDTQKTNFRLLSFDNLLAIRDAVRNIDHLAGLKNTLLAAVKKRKFDATRDELSGSIVTNSKGKRAPQVETGLPVQELLRKGAAFLAMNQKYASIARQLDGWKDGGLAWELLIFPANNVADAETEKNAAASLKLQEIFSVYGVSDIAGMYTKEFVPELGVGISKMGRLMIALNWGNWDNREKLREGLGITLGRDGRLTDQQIWDGVLKKLDKRDWQFVQSIWDYFDTFWPEIEALARRVDGIPPDRVEAMEIQTRFGTFRGGYFPIKYDERQSRESKKDIAREAAERQLRGASFRASTRHGHREQRVRGVRRPIKLGFGVIFSHVGQVIHDLTHYEFLIDTNRLLKDKKVERAIKEHYGDLAYTEMQKAVEDMAAGNIAATDAYEEAANWLRRGTTTAVLGFKVTTALLQPLGLLSSIVRVGPKWVLRGLMRWMGGGERQEFTVRWVHEKSSFMRHRDRTMMREINEIQNELRLRGKVFSKFQGTALWMTVKAQMIADMPTWLGSYEKAMEQLNFKGASSKQEQDAIEKKVIGIADQAVRDSQGSGHIHDLARIQRGNAFVKLFTMFSTFFNARWNLAREVVGRTNFKSPVDVGRMMVDMLILYPMPAILAVLSREVLRGGLGAEDDDKLYDDLLSEALLEPMTDVIGLRELVGPLKGFKYRGPAGLKVIGETGDLAVQFGQGELDKGLWRELNDVAGVLFHYPAEQIESTFKGFNAWEEGKGGPGSILLGPPRKRK
jgi:hypothetical protein